MNLRDRPVAVWALPLATLLAALLVLGSDAGGVAGRLRGILFDAYQHASPRPYQDGADGSRVSVRVLDVDAAAIARLGPWPWPHAVLAKVANEVKAAGAAALVLAFPVDRPDPTLPKSLVAELPAGDSDDAVRAAIAGLPSPDEALGASLAQIETVSGFMLTPSGGAGVPVAKARFAYVGAADPFGHAQAFSAASVPIPEVEVASVGLGALNLTADADGKIRRMPTLFRLGNSLVPSLDAEMLRIAEVKRTITVKSDDGGDGLFTHVPGIASLSTNAGDLPTAPDGSFWIAYSGQNKTRDVSAAALDAGTATSGALARAIVILGAPDDVAQTPDGARPTAEIHAEALENMLYGTWLRRPAAASLAELICLAIVGAAAVYLFARAGLIFAGIFSAAAIAAGFVVSYHLYKSDRVLFDALGPGLGLAAVFVTGAAARALEVARSRARLRSAFADALPPPAIDQLARKPQLLRLEGETRIVTVLSCGIRGFGGLATSLREDPASFTRLVQRVLTPLLDEVLSHGGTIDRLTSEGFTAFWNAPLDDAEHAMHACEAASRMTEVMARVNDTITHERRIDGAAFAPVEIGIGISTGPAIAGGFSAHGRAAYSVTGDCALIAARIQNLSSQYGPAVIVSESTRKASERGFAFLEVDYLACGPQDEPVKLFAMLGNPVVRASPKFRALMTFHEHIFQSLRAQQWTKARALIEQCRKLSGASQKLYDLHLARIAYFETNPPGAEWDGAFRPILK